MRTPAWIKKLGGHAGELYVCAELSKRGIPNAMLPENFTDNDILFGNKEGGQLGYIQVKSCHPQRPQSFILRETQEAWADAPPNEFCVFVWLGNPKECESPSYWIATKREVGQLCRAHSAHRTDNWERRFFPSGISAAKPAPDYAVFLPAAWRNRWPLFEPFTTAASAEAQRTSN